MYTVMGCKITITMTPQAVADISYVTVNPIELSDKSYPFTLHNT